MATVSLESDSSVTWKLNEFKDEKIRTGTEFVMVIAEVSHPLPRIAIHNICAAYREKFFGFIREPIWCDPGKNWLGQISATGVVVCEYYCDE